MDDTSAQVWLEHAHALLARRRAGAVLAALAQAENLGLPSCNVAGSRWVCHMLLGNFEAAWRVSDAVIADTPAAGFNRRDLPPHRRLVWRGTALAGHRVLVRCHHGLGDCIQFLRYVPRLRGVAHSIAVQAPPALFGLLADLPGVDEVVPLADGVADPAYDVDIECMELPHAFRTVAATVPAPVPYLAAPAEPVRRDRPRVGLVWAAGDWDGGLRSVPADLLAPLCRLPGIDWLCLQRGVGLDRLRPEHGLRFAEPPGDDLDLAAAAARLRTLDLVITVDTMIAHLAGSLGVPTWVLLAFAADWRWQLRRHSLWYPSMRLVRQPAPGDWRSVVEAVQEALPGFLGSGQGGARWSRAEAKMRAI